MPQAALISLVGSSVSKTVFSRARAFGGQLVAGKQQQPAVRLGRVDLHTAPALLLVLDPLADVGEHLVRQHHEVEVVQDDPGQWQRPADSRRVRYGWVDRQRHRGTPCFATTSTLRRTPRSGQGPAR